MSGIDLRRLVEAAGPLARLTLETDDAGEPRVVQLSPLPRPVERAVEAVWSGPPAGTEPDPLERQASSLEVVALELVTRLREIESGRTRVDLAVDVELLNTTQADEQRARLMRAEEQALVTARNEIRTLLGLPL